MTEAGPSESVWRVAVDGLSLRVRLTPKGGRDAVCGIVSTADGPALSVRVRVLPEDGAANAALEALVAKWLGLAKRDVAVTAGHKSRNKSLGIAGEPAALRAVLEAHLSAMENG